MFQTLKSLIARAGDIHTQISIITYCRQDKNVLIVWAPTSYFSLGASKIVKFLNVTTETRAFNDASRKITLKILRFNQKTDSGLLADKRMFPLVFLSVSAVLSCRAWQTALRQVEPEPLRRPRQHKVVSVSKSAPRSLAFDSWSRCIVRQNKRTRCTGLRWRHSPSRYIKDRHTEQTHLSFAALSPKQWLEGDKLKQ